MSKPRIVKVLVGGTLVAAVVLLLAGCGKQLSERGWTVVPNTRKASLAVKNADLGIVLGDVRLALLNDSTGVVDTLRGWHVKRSGTALQIQTDRPKKTTWTVTVSDSAVDFRVSASNAVLFGVAPASEQRIPARVRSQDNGVMYTALGPISAANIHHLFDRQTDIMICFPEMSRLRRNPSQQDQMVVQISVSPKAPEISLLRHYYTDVVGIAHYQKTKFKPVYVPYPGRFKRAPTGWCSWYCYYMKANEKDMVKETDVLARELKPYGLEYVQLDACYTRGKEANWLEWNKELFPHGGKWLFQYISSKGLKPGLWVNAYGANYAKPAMADKYPENFFLRDKNGRLSGACCTADTTVVRLDYTNPAVLEKHLKPLFHTLVDDWGLRYLKDAGWGTWMDYYEKNRANAFDSTLDSRVVYRRVQKAIREIMGPTNYINGCAMHEVGVGFGYYDGSRVGGDDYARWAPEKGKGNRNSMSMQTFFNSLFGANYLNGICWWSDPDVVMVRPPLTMEEARTIVTTIALSGQTYMISDFMAELPDERMELYKKTMPTMPIHAVDLFPFRTEPVCCPKPKSFPKALDLKVSAATGTYDVVAVYNWSDQPVMRTVAFARDLGLDRAPRLVFDFWQQKFLGIFTDSLSVEIPVHGVRALVIRPVEPTPQVIATSRHISGAYSVKSVSWDEGAATLSGRSQAVNGIPYAVFVYVPGGKKLSQVTANTKVLYHTQTGSVVKVLLQGKEEPIEWKLVFGT